MAVIATIQTTMQNRQSTFSATDHSCGIRDLIIRNVSPDVSLLSFDYKYFLLNLVNLSKQTSEATCGDSGRET